jgi:hypothetical protein
LSGQLLVALLSHTPRCEDRVLDGPASGGKGSKGIIWLDCIRGKDVAEPRWCMHGDLAAIHKDLSLSPPQYFTRARALSLSLSLSLSRSRSLPPPLSLSCLLLLSLSLSLSLAHARSLLQAGSAWILSGAPPSRRERERRERGAGVGVPRKRGIPGRASYWGVRCLWLCGWRGGGEGGDTALTTPSCSIEMRPFTKRRISIS